MDPNNPQQPYTPPQGNPYAPYGMYDPGQQYGMPMKHSGLGIASFTIAILATLGTVATMIVMSMFVAKHGPKLDPQHPPPEMVGAVCGFAVAIAAAAIGAVLGIVAVYQRDRKRVFAILGLSLNGIMLLLFGVMLLIGLLNR